MQATATIQSTLQGINQATITAGTSTNTKKGDGKDTIIGYNPNDTIELTGFTTAEGNIITAQSGFDTQGNYIIRVPNGSITLKNKAFTNTTAFHGQLGGTTLNVKLDGTTLGLGTPVKNESGAITGYIIPKLVLGTTGSEKVTIDSSAANPNYTAGFTYNAQAGNDSIKVATSAVSIVAGAGNDTVTISAVTNAKADGTIDATKAPVTIYGGYGNDSINATADTVAGTGDAAGKTVYSSHVYQFGANDGRDSILGFNENDTIEITAATSAISGLNIRGDFVVNNDGTKSYVVYVGGAQLWLVGYEGGKKITVRDSEGKAVLIGGTEGYDENDEVTTDADEVVYCMVPKELRGSTGNDTGATKQLTLDVTKDNFTINALAGNDYISVAGASSVSVNAGAGNDTIKLDSATKTVGTSTETVYGNAVTIDAGAGNDIIYAETIAGTGTDEGKTVANDGAEAHVYIFRASDGNDTIYGFKEKDSIQIPVNASGNPLAYYVNSSVASNKKDLVLNFSSADKGRVTSTITLKDYVDDPVRDKTVLIIPGTGSPIKEDIPRLVAGDNGNNNLINNNEEYSIQGYAGNDTIHNASVRTGDVDYTAEKVTIDAGAGNDIVVNAGEDTSINAGAGNDKVYLVGPAGGSSVSVGAGTDTIYASDAGNNTYQFGDNDGTTYILNYNNNDLLHFKSDNANVNLTHETTENGVVFTFGYTKVILKGAAKSTAAASTIIQAGVKSATGAAVTFKGNNITDFEELPADTLVRFKVNEDAESTPYSVERKMFGTSGNDSTASTALLNLNVIDETDEDNPVILHEADNYTIKAQAGNDLIISDGDYLSIDAGIGNDTVILGPQASGTIEGGLGNDFIVGNANGNVYVYNVGDGNDTILGFNYEADILSIVGGENYDITKAPTVSVTNTGLAVKVGSYTVLLKGEAKITNEEDANHVNKKITALETAVKNNATRTYPALSDYNMLAGGLKISIDASNGTDSESYAVTIPKQMYGTNANDSGDNALTVAAGGDFDGYEVYGLNGNDLIKNEGANDLTIYGGAGNDTISLAGSAGEGVKVVPGVGNDSIVVAPNTSEIGRLYEFALGDGVNTIDGFSSHDTINITSATGTPTIRSTAFSGDYFVLTLSDNRTKIYLKESNSDADGYQKAGTQYATEFTLQINGVAQDKSYKIPKIRNVTGATEKTFNTTPGETDGNNAIIIGDTAINNIVLDGTSEASVTALAGNDNITVTATEDDGESKNNTINGGAGNDKIYIKYPGQVIQYKAGEGNDTIYGFTDDDTLQLAGVSGNVITTLMTGTTFSLKYGGYSITFKNEDGTDIAPDTVIKVRDWNGNVLKDKRGNDIADLVVPKILQGTNGSDSTAATKLENTLEGYKIYALAGNDLVENGTAYVKANDVSIDAANGNDTVVSNGDNVLIDGGANNDSIKIIGGSNNTIYGDAGDDLIWIQDLESSGNTISGGSGKDTLIGNEGGHTYLYDATSGEDTILGFSSEDTIKITGNVALSVKANANGTYSNEVVYNVSNEGLRLYFKDSSSHKYLGSILFKGQRLEGDEHAANILANFAPLTKEDSIHFDINGSGYDFQVPAKRFVTKNVAFENEADYSGYTIEGSTVADTVTNTADYVTIEGDKGNDLIVNTGSHVLIDGGADHDIILLSTGKNAAGREVAVENPDSEDVTIRGGAGNDTIYGNNNGDDEEHQNGEPHVYQYAIGDGKDVIYYFGLNDIIEFSGNYTSAENASPDFEPYANVEFENTQTGDPAADDPNKKDVVIKVSGGSITIKDVPVEQEVKYRFTYTDAQGNTQTSSERKFAVARVHSLSGDEGKDATTHLYTNEDADYSIFGTAQQNFIANEAENVTINTGAGNNSIGNASENVTIIADSGNDTIVNTSANVEINAGSGANKVDNSNENVIITADVGNDTIINSGSNVEINAGDGANTIANNADGNESKITTGSGKDTITNKADNVTITTGAEADVISLTADDDATSNGVTVTAGTGNDSIYADEKSSSRWYNYNEGDGNDVIVGWKEDDVLQLSLAADSYIQTLNNTNGFYIYMKDVDGKTTGSVLLTSLTAAGAMTALPGGIHVNVFDENGDVYGRLYDSVNGTYNGTDGLEIPKIKYAIGATSVTSNELADYLVQGDAANNKIFNIAENVTINAGAGNDNISVGGDNASINAGAGNDSIVIYYQNTDNDPATNEEGGNYSAMTIRAGAGNDTVKLSSSHTNGVIYQYTYGEGLDTILNYNSNDIINITGNVTAYSTSVTNDGFLIKVNNNANSAILLKNYAHDPAETKYVNIVRGEYTDESIPEQIIVPRIQSITAANRSTTITDDQTFFYGTTGVDSITNQADNVAIYAQAGNDSIVLGNNSYVSVYAGAGNDTIENEDENHNGVVYAFANKEGTNTIKNFGSNDTIQYTGGTLTLGENLRTVATDNGGDTYDLTVYVGNTAIFIPGYGVENQLVNVIDSEGTDKTFTVGKILVGNGASNDLDNTGSGRISGTNAESPFEINAYGGNDTIKNEGAFVKMDAGAGNDTIYNYYTEIPAEEQDGVPTIIAGNNSTIIGGAGNDSIENQANDVTIDAGADNDDITLTSGNTVLVDAGAGNDTITYHGGDSVSIYGGDGKDYIQIIAPTAVPTNKLTVYGGPGLDTIVNNDATNGHVYQFTGDNVNNGGVIEGFTANDTIQIMDDNKTIGGLGAYSYVGKYLLLTAGKTKISLETSLTPGTAINIIDKNGTAIKKADGSDYTIPLVQRVTGTDSTNVTAAKYTVFGNTANNVIVNNADEVVIDLRSGGNNKVENQSGGTKASISGGAGADTIDNAATNVTILSGAGADTIGNTATNVTINAGADGDTITNSGATVTVDAGDGADTITNNATDVSISGGAGNDTISNSKGNVTILAGTGNDKIINTAEAGSAVVYQFGSGDGNNTITGFNATDGKISLTAAVPKSVTLTNDGKITFAAGAKITLEGSSAFAQDTGIKFINSTGTESTVKVNTILFSSGNDDTAVSADGVNAYAYAGDDTIAVSGKNVNIYANGGGTKKVNVTAAPTSVSEGVRISLGADNDQVTITSYSRVSIAGGENAVTASGNNNTIIGGTGVDKITISGSAENNSITTGAGNDTISISSSAGGHTIIGGAGNDYIYSNGKGNYFYYTPSATEGADTIEGFDKDSDVLLLSANKAITAQATTGGANVVINSTKPTVFLKGINANDVIKYQIGTTEKTVTVAAESSGSGGSGSSGSYVAEAPVAVLDDIFDDDNFITNDAQLSSITEITADNFSAGKIENIDFTTLAQNNLTPIAYSSKR